MIFGQGATRCHPHVQDLITVIHREEKGADKEFNSLMRKTIGYSLKNFFRGIASAYLPGFGGGKSADPLVRKFEKKINRLSATLAVQADFALLVLGGDLKRKEMLSARLGDVMSYLFMAMGNIKFYLQSENKAELTHYFNYGTSWALKQAEDALFAYVDNFPNRVVANILSVKLGLPFMSRTKVTDKMITDLAEETLKDNGAKKELTSLVRMIGRDGFTILEDAYKAKLEVLPLLDKMKKALRTGDIKKQLTFAELVDAASAANVISEDEKAALVSYDEKRKLAIAVDEYTFDLELIDKSTGEEPVLKSA
jgi:acyl-CoA dehydrogenase